MARPDRKFGQKREEIKEYQEEVIQIDRVTRVVKGGRRMRFRATVVVGNKKGKVGIGIGKANEVPSSIQKAIRLAKKNLIQVPIIRNTIPHDIKFKYKSAIVLLIPASEGTGMIAGSAVRKVIELAGIKNILSKALGSANRINNAKATFMALSQLKRPIQTESTVKDQKEAIKPSHPVKTDQQKSIAQTIKDVIKEEKKNSIPKTENKKVEKKGEPRT